MNIIVPIKENIYDLNGNLYIAKGKKIKLDANRAYFFSKLGILQNILNQLTEPKSFELRNKSIMNCFEKFEGKFSFTSSNYFKAAINLINKILFEEKDSSWNIYFNILSNQLESYYTHGINVAIISAMISISIGYDEEKIKEIILGALFHDIGKVMIDKSILEKTPNERSKEEVEILKKHTEFGKSSFSNIDFPTVCKDIILKHHERIDGSGFPHGLSKDEIPEEVKIVMVADFFDTYTSPHLKGIENFKLFNNIEEIINMMELMPDTLPSKYVKILKLILNL